MKKLVIVFLMLVVNCSFAQTQADINKEANAQYQKADRELNEVYKNIMMTYKSDTAFISNL